MTTNPMQTEDESQLSVGTLPEPVVHEFAPVARELLACAKRSELLKGLRRDAIKRMIVEAIDVESPSVLSLDVFDTFLLRNDRSEARRFAELSAAARARIAKTLAIEDESLPSDTDFLIARADAMAASYRLRKPVDGCREGHISEIIRLERRALGLPSDADEIFRETEIGYEVQNLAINPVLLDVAREFRKRGGKVILVSDMYLGEDEIRTIVERIDRKAPDSIDAIFSSADHVVSKRSGKLFALIEDKLGETGQEILHVGDMLEGDVFRARTAGWATLHFPVSRAETLRRNHDLSRFKSEMNAQGIEVPWAKV